MLHRTVFLLTYKLPNISPWDVEDSLANSQHTLRQLREGRTIKTIRQIGLIFKHSDVIRSDICAVSSSVLVVCK